MATDNERPEPDRLLARIQGEQAREARGQLRIYFGSSAGVGKTFAMLQAAQAQAQRSAGVDVVAGVIETHGRNDTGENWPVFEAETLQRGLVEAGIRRPQRIILDLGLPDGDGVDFLKDLRHWSAVHVIVLSARSHQAHKIAALDAGADDYITKPFSAGELLARVRVALRRQPGAGVPLRRCRGRPGSTPCQPRWPGRAANADRIPAARRGHR